jgi:hypothetical protein
MQSYPNAKVQMDDSSGILMVGRYAFSFPWPIGCRVSCPIGGEQPPAAGVADPQPAELPDGWVDDGHGLWAWLEQAGDVQGVGVDGHGGFVYGLGSKEGGEGEL